MQTAKKAQNFSLFFFIYKRPHEFTSTIKNAAERFQSIGKYMYIDFNFKINTEVNSVPDRDSSYRAHAYSPYLVVT